MGIHHRNENFTKKKHNWLHTGSFDKMFVQMSFPFLCMANNDRVIYRGYAVNELTGFAGPFLLALLTKFCLQEPERGGHGATPFFAVRLQKPHRGRNRKIATFLFPGERRRISFFQIPVPLGGCWQALRRTHDHSNKPQAHRGQKRGGMHIGEGSCLSLW